MNQKSLAAAVLIGTLAVGLRADADTANFSFSGAGVSGSGILTFGADTVANDPIGAYAISGISGTFTDANLNINNEAITGIVAIAPGPYQGTFSRESDRIEHNGSRILDLLRQPLLPWRLSGHVRGLSGGRRFSGYLRSAIHPREWRQRRPVEQRDVPRRSTAQLWCRRHRSKYESYRLLWRGRAGICHAGARFSLFTGDRAARCPGVPDEIRGFPVLSRVGAG